MKCTECPYHYVNSEWRCWSGNKGLGRCCSPPSKKAMCYSVKDRTKLLKQRKEIKKDD